LATSRSVGRGDGVFATVMVCLWVPLAAGASVVWSIDAVQT